MTTTVLELLDCLCVTQEYETTLGKNWLLAHSIHADYNIVHNFLGEFLAFKGRLYTENNLPPMVSYEYYDACGHFG